MFFVFGVKSLGTCKILVKIFSTGGVGEIFASARCATKSDPEEEWFLVILPTQMSSTPEELDENFEELETLCVVIEKS